MISRLKKLSYDSTYVAPNGVIWNDDIWDTYDDYGLKQQKSNINREWKFEEPVDNQEWILQQQN